MAGMEEQTALCWKLCLRWKASTAVQAKKTQERPHGCLTWPEHWSALAFQLCGLGRRTATFTRKILRVLCGYFEHQQRVQFGRCVAEPLETITAITHGSKWSCLFFRVVLHDALRKVMKVYSLLKLKVFAVQVESVGRGSALPKKADTQRSSPPGNPSEGVSPIIGPTRCSYGPLADFQLHQATLRRVAVSAGQRLRRAPSSAIVPGATVPGTHLLANS